MLGDISGDETELDRNKRDLAGLEGIWRDLVRFYENKWE